MIDQAMALIRTLTLPDGRCLHDTLDQDPWLERDVLAPILAKDDAGRPLHRQCWIELARGHYKTGAVAAVAIAEALSAFGTHIYAIASDLDQARLLTEAISGQCFRNPKLAAAFRQGKDEFTVKGTHSRIRVMASDAPGFYGIGVDSRRLRIIADELTQWPTRAMFDAAVTTLPKVADSQLIIITNAGIIGSWQEEARASAAESGYLFHAPGVIASWLDPADIERVRKNVPPSVHRRFFENMWVLSAGDFISDEQLARCIDPDAGPRIRGEREQMYFVGLDLGLTHDRTVRSIVHYDAERDEIVLDAMRVWAGSRTNPVLIEEVERDLLEVAAAFHSPVFLADPWQLKGSIERLRTTIAIQEFTFSATSVKRLSETLYSLISTSKLRLYPDEELRRELLQLQVRQTTVGWRIDHQGGGFSDRAVSLGLAALGALDYWPDVTTTVYLDPLTGEYTDELPDRIRIGADI